MGTKTFEQLSEAQLFWQPNEASNSIAMIIKHMHGNMLSRFTDFLTSDGEKEWRNRDAEFENDVSDKETLLAQWEEGWHCLFQAIDPLTTEDLEKIVYVRNMGHTVIEAVNRQLSHYSYHVGQIVYIGRLIIDQDWTSLSIPRGESKAYNQEMFAKAQRKAHFTDEL